MKWMSILVLLALAVPAVASKHVTVAQLDHTLSSMSAQKKSDLKLAQQLGWLELDQRVSLPMMSKFIKLVKPGSESSLALRLLVDRAEFLDLPPADLPKAAAPDGAAQAKMLEEARQYVSETMKKLPNLLATRTTIRFDDTPQIMAENAWPVRAGLHMVDRQTGQASLQDEFGTKILADPVEPPALTPAKDKKAPGSEGEATHARAELVSKGEFSATMVLLFVDALRSNLTWSHWERGGGGMIAVYQYAVPRDNSHWIVAGFAAPTSGGGGRGGRRGGGGGLRQQGQDSLVHVRPGYHGYVWVEAATGTILRITMIADPTPGAPFKRAASLVQYAPLTVGDLTVVCPVHSVLLSEADESDPEPHNNSATKWLYETLFTDYHRFGTTLKIVSVSDPPAPAGSAK